MHHKIRQRIEAVVDPGSFNRFDPGRATGFVTGSGWINGREIYITAVDHRDLPNSPFDGIQHHYELLELALAKPRPVVMIMDAMAHHKPGKSTFPKDSAKLLIHRKGIGYWYSLHARLSGLVPQVCVVCGRLGASLTFPVALCDAVVMVQDAGMSIGRPDVVEELLGRPIDYFSLGSPEMHARTSGTVDVIAKDDTTAMTWVRNYLDHFPSKAGASIPLHAAALPLEKDKPISELLPREPAIPFAVQPLINRLLDRDSFVEIKKEYAGEVITGLCRIEGFSFGLVASNSIYHSGILFPETCDKMCRFIALCDAFSLPLVFLADIPGFMIGSGAEQAGIIRHGAELFRTIARSTTPKLSITLRRNYTAGVYAMAGPGISDGSFIALPGAVISVYGAMVMKKLSSHLLSNSERKQQQEMLNAAAHPEQLLEQGLIDEIIQPEELRPRIAEFLKDYFLSKVKE